jgi:hypothetical protein
MLAVLRRTSITLALVALTGTGSAVAQTSLTRPRPAEQELQDLNALTVQRQQDALRQQQQSFDRNQRVLEAERNRSIPILPSDPDYRGTMFRR